MAWHVFLTDGYMVVIDFDHRSIVEESETFGENRSTPS